MWRRRVRRLLLTSLGEAVVLAFGAAWVYLKGERLYPRIAEQFGAVVPVLDHLEPEPPEEVRRGRIPCTCVWSMSPGKYRRELADPECGSPHLEPG